MDIASVLKAIADWLKQDILRPLFALAAMCLSIIIYRLNKKQKKLSYLMVSRAWLVRVGEKLSSRVKILLDGKEVEDLSLAVIRVTNTGNEPIKREDFAEPLRILSFAKIISVDVVDSSPPLLHLPKASPAPENGKRVGSIWDVEGLLLNPGDSLTIHVLLEGEDDPRFQKPADPPTVAMLSRIVGVKRMDYGEPIKVRAAFVQAATTVLREVIGITFTTNSESDNAGTVKPTDRKGR